MIWDKFLYLGFRDKAGDGDGGGDEGDKTDKDDSSKDDVVLGDDDEEEDEKETSDDKVEDDELDEKEIAESKQLYKLLKSPDSRDSTLRLLAERAGILNTNKDLTKKEEKKEARKLVDILKDKLSDYPSLAEKLAPALEEILSTERAGRDADITTLKAAQLENQVEASLNRLAKETKGESRKFEPKMIALMDKVKPGEGVSTQEYMETLFTLASSQSAAKSAAARIANKINKNAADLPSRIAGKNGSKGDLVIPKKSMTSREAAEFALKSIFK